MDQEEQKHQINMLLTAVLMKKLGKSYDLNHDGSTKDIVIF
jgi:hypothetical protein